MSSKAIQSITRLPPRACQVAANAIMPFGIFLMPPFSSVPKGLFSFARAGLIAEALMLYYTASTAPARPGTITKDWVGRFEAVTDSDGQHPESSFIRLAQVRVFYFVPYSPQAQARSNPVNGARNQASSAGSIFFPFFFVFVLPRCVLTQTLILCPTSSAFSHRLIIIN